MTGPRHDRRRANRAVALAAAIPLALTAAACGTSATGSTGGGATTVTTTNSAGKTVTTTNLVLTAQDYYTDEPGHSLWAKTLTECGTASGVTVNQQSIPGVQLVAKVLQEASSHTMPDLLMLDNPDMQQIATTGALTPLSDYGVDTTGFYPTILSAGTYQGKVYGLAPNVNSIALIYNKKLLAKAGITTPPTTWAELSADAKKATGGGVYGMAMSAIASYEGTWQFLPFFWTAGADLKNLDSPQAAQALTYWKSFIDDGTMSKSSLNWTQANVNDQFIAGKAAFMINGPWNFPNLNSAKGLEYGVASIPVPKAGDKVVAPLGGEVWTVPMTSPDRQKAAAKVITCLNSPANQLKYGSANFTVPSRIAASQQYAKQVPSMASFVTEVSSARARTAELGTKWPVTATAIYNAIQSALTGKESVAQALATAQKSSTNGS